MQFRSCCNWLRNAWGEISPKAIHEQLPLSVAPARFLHRPFAEPARGQPSHDLGLPGRLSPLAPVCPGAPEALPFGTADGRSRRFFSGAVLGSPRTQPPQLYSNTK